MIKFLIINVYFCCRWGGSSSSYFQNRISLIRFNFLVSKIWFLLIKWSDYFFFLQFHRWQYKNLLLFWYPKFSQIIVIIFNVEYFVHWTVFCMLIEVIWNDWFDPDAFVCFTNQRILSLFIYLLIWNWKNIKNF